MLLNYLQRLLADPRSRLDCIVGVRTTLYFADAL